MKEAKELSIDELGLAVRTRNVLARMNVKTAKDLEEFYADVNDGIYRYRINPGCKHFIRDGVYTEEEMLKIPKYRYKDKPRGFGQHSLRDLISCMKKHGLDTSRLEPGLIIADEKLVVKNCNYCHKDDEFNDVLITNDLKAGKVLLSQTEVFIERNKLHLYLSNSNNDGFSVSFMKINFCPMCGRRL